MVYYESIGALLLISVVITLLRAIKGPTIQDRVIAIDTISAIVIALIAVISFISSIEILIDIALIYAILNFIGTLAVSKYFLKDKMWKE